MLTLYYAPGACSLAPHIALEEAGIEHALEKVDLAARKTATGADYLAVNPKGYVPALKLEDGSVLTEVAVVLQWIADRRARRKLAPRAGTPERYRLMEWLNFIATEVHKGMSPLFRPTTPEDYKAVIKDNLAKRFATLDAALKGRDYLMGERFTVADAYAFTVLNWTSFLKIDRAPYPDMDAYMWRVGKRSKVKKAMKAEGILK